MQSAKEIEGRGEGRKAEKDRKVPGVAKIFGEFGVVHVVGTQRAVSDCDCPMATAICRRWPIYLDVFLVKTG